MSALETQPGRNRVPAPRSGQRFWHPPKPGSHYQVWDTNCHQCGWQRHKGKRCPAWNKECYVCRQVGHFARKCSMQKVQYQAGNRKLKTPSKIRRDKKRMEAFIRQRQCSQNNQVQTVMEIQTSSDQTDKIVSLEAQLADLQQEILQQQSAMAAQVTTIKDLEDINNQIQKSLESAKEDLLYVSKAQSENHELNSQITKLKEENVYLQEDFNETKDILDDMCQLVYLGESKNLSKDLKTDTAKKKWFNCWNGSGCWN